MQTQVAGTSIVELARKVRAASIQAAQLSSGAKQNLLTRLAEALEQNREALQQANQGDVNRAEENGLSGPMLERLRLKDTVLDQMALSLREVAQLPDPVGEINRMARRPNGMMVGRMRIPLGVIGIIYESRPNVTTDAAGLCLKAGNACLLRGGSEAHETNMALGNLIAEVLEAQHLPREMVTVVPLTDRAVLTEMLKLEDEIDLIIPRGGEGLIRFVAEHSRIPVIKHYQGICHTFVDASADSEMATSVIVNGKAQRPSVCNATETLLIHHQALQTCWVSMAEGLLKAGVELRCCDRSWGLLREKGLETAQVKRAEPGDYGQEFLDYILAVQVVDSFEEAVRHIQRYGSNHTEAIVTQDHQQAMRFLREVNSSVVLVNASTRFADGHQLGLGAEIGISTTKLHSYGPMGIEELTTQKFVVLGEGQIRQ
ncbi:MAG: glutamate-5-semialdehyde dehydrogenase [Blastocatellia bacterium]|nr:glutamate-5-semialdehyde dehydrogenase [Blastocatellia bacterium]